MRLIPSDSPEYTALDWQHVQGTPKQTSKRPCPTCGAPRDRCSKLCRACHKAARLMASALVCACGGRKSRESATCRACYERRREAEEKKTTGLTVASSRTKDRQERQAKAKVAASQVVKPLGTITDKGGKPRASRHAAAPATVTAGERERIAPILRGLCRLQECEESGKKHFTDAGRFEIHATPTGKGNWAFTSVPVGADLKPGSIRYQRFIRRGGVDSRTWDMTAIGSLDSGRALQMEREATHA